MIYYRYGLGFLIIFLQAISVDIHIWVVVQLKLFL